MKERFDESTARTGIALKEARAACDEAYFAMRRRLNAFAEVGEGGEQSEPFIRSLNTVIAKFNEMIRFTGLPEQKKYPDTKSLPSVCYAYFKDLQDFQHGEHIYENANW